MILSGATSLSHELREDFERLWEAPPVELPRVQQARELIAQAPVSDTARGQLITLYLRHPDDPDLFAATLPEWPDELVAVQATADPRELGEILTTFCDLLPGKFTFEYLDTAARFMARVFRATDDPVLRELILRRLLRMAVDNNRFAVGRVFVGLVRGLQAPHDRNLARTVLEDDPEAVQWLADYASGAKDVPLLNEIVQRLEANGE